MMSDDQPFAVLMPKCLTAVTTASIVGRHVKWRSFFMIAPCGEFCKACFGLAIGIPRSLNRRRGEGFQRTAPLVRLMANKYLFQDAA